MTNSDGDRGSRSYMGVGNDGRGMTLDAYRKLTETLREAGYRPICNSYIFRGIPKSKANYFGQVLTDTRLMQPTSSEPNMEKNPRPL
jgi:hypothetical protein